MLRRAVPFLIFAIAYVALNFDGMDGFEFGAAVYIAGTLAVFWEITGERPILEIQKLVLSYPWGGPAASALYALSLLVVGGAASIVVRGLGEIL